MPRELGFALFTAIFLLGGYQQYQQPTPRAEQARRVGLPATDKLVRWSGLTMMVAAFGLQIPITRRLSALVLALQLPVVTFVGHRFWEMEPGPQRTGQTVQFAKNVSLLGACLVMLAGAERRR
jgi:uncharacterized membrane protein YphA (DoxX/SURF4 family)